MADQPAKVHAFFEGGEQFLSQNEVSPLLKVPLSPPSVAEPPHVQESGVVGLQEVLCPPTVCCVAFHLASAYLPPLLETSGGPY